MKYPIAEILESAALVVSLPEWWAQEGMAFTASGAPTQPYNPEAVCFCSIGAIAAASASVMTHRTLHHQMEAASDAQDELFETVRARFGRFEQVEYWNDDKRCTAKQVARAMWDTAQEVRKNEKRQTARG